MYNFFVNKNQIIEDKVTIVRDDYNHIANVLRMKAGDKIIISNKDNSKSFLAIIEDITKEKVICKIIKEKESTESNIDVTIFQGITKSDKMEYIIQKATELGANMITPVEMKYCIGKINDENKKISRWQKIAEVAAKQCKRNKIPQISKPTNIYEICKNVKNFDIVLVAYENEKTITIKQALEKNENSQKIAIII